MFTSLATLATAGIFLSTPQLEQIIHNGKFYHLNVHMLESNPERASPETLAFFKGKLEGYTECLEIIYHIED